jgi:hypothetical protein
VKRHKKQHQQGPLLTAVQDKENEPLRKKDRILLLWTIAIIGVGSRRQSVAFPISQEYGYIRIVMVSSPR